MKIKGIQKLTLIDYPGKVACTLFLFGCNFRCGFCHNPELVLEESKQNYSEEEVFNFLTKRKKYLDGVCITGGEPLLTLSEDFLKRIKSLGYLIKIDTNGSCPERLRYFIEQGLIDFISMDIKVSKERYSEIIGCNCNISKIEESIKIISEFPNYEFRTTILEEIHDENGIKKIIEWINGLINKKIKRFSLQGFKNKGKFIDNSFVYKKDTSEEYLLKLKEISQNFAEIVEIRI